MILLQIEVKCVMFPVVKGLNYTSWPRTLDTLTYTHSEIFHTNFPYYLHVKAARTSIINIKDFAVSSYGVQLLSLTSNWLTQSYKNPYYNLKRMFEGVGSQNRPLYCCSCCIRQLDPRTVSPWKKITAKELPRCCCCCESKHAGRWRPVLDRPPAICNWGTKVQPLPPAECKQSC